MHEGKVCIRDSSLLSVFPDSLTGPMERGDALFLITMNLTFLSNSLIMPGTIKLLSYHYPPRHLGRHNLLMLLAFGNTRRLTVGQLTRRCEVGLQSPNK